jgi:hypothetical protein
MVYCRVSTGRAQNGTGSTCLQSCCIEPFFIFLAGMLDAQPDQSSDAGIRRHAITGVLLEALRSARKSNPSRRTCITLHPLTQAGNSSPRAALRISVSSPDIAPSGRPRCARHIKGPLTLSRFSIILLSPSLAALLFRLSRPLPFLL